MKKNIIIAALAITTFLALVFAVYKDTEAEKQWQLAREIDQQSMDNARKAKEELYVAEMEADRQRKIAEECVGTKK